jgi:hypothetical protein
MYDNANLCAEFCELCCHLDESREFASQLTCGGGLQYEVFKAPHFRMHESNVDILVVSHPLLILTDAIYQYP